MCVRYSFDKSCWFSRSTTLSPFTSASSRLGFACAALFCRRERLRSTWREMLMGVVRACMFRIPPRRPWNYDDWIKAFADRSYRCDVANYFIISIIWSTWRRYAVTALGSISYGERHVGRGISVTDPICRTSIRATVSGRVYVVFAHCVRQQHGSMAQTSRIYLPAARYFVAKRELYRDVSVREKSAYDERYAGLRSRVNVKI